MEPVQPSKMKWKAAMDNYPPILKVKVYMKVALKPVQPSNMKRKGAMDNYPPALKFKV